MQQEPFRFQTRIRFIDTDASGRIHYTAMFRYFESAEIEFLRALGISYALHRGYTFPRVHVECDFTIPLKHDDIIDIEVYLTEIGRSSVRFEFRTLKADELAAHGVVVVVCVDSQTERAIRIPEEARAKLHTALAPRNGVDRKH